MIVNTEPRACLGCGLPIIIDENGIACDADHDVTGKDTSNLIEHECDGNESDVA